MLADNARHYQGHDTVLIGALRYRFNYLDSNAVRHGQLRWDTSAPSRLFDVAGRSGSPYLLREVAVAAALADSTHNGFVNFRLDPASLFSNVGPALSNASIDFGDGSGAHTCVPGQVLQISYGTAGRKTLRYVLNYADGSQFTTYSTLYVPKAAACANCRGKSYVEPCRMESLTAGIPFQGIAGQAQVSYFYSTNPLKTCPASTPQPITKPIIIVDGIDYDGVREGGDIYGEYLAYKDATDVRNLGVELRREGYDIVILDFPNVEQKVKIGPFTYSVVVNHSGADYMERNAFTLVTLIQQLNQKLAAAGSSEKIVVIGPSMGGQIARYALAYMEHNSLPHNTRLFLSLDSPHNGATIPIGLQHFVDFFAKDSEDENLRNGLAELDSPAARELSQHHHSQGTVFQADPLRSQFMSDLANLGSYPSQLRRVAVTNGALDGAPQIDQNGQAILAGQQAFGLEQRGVPPGNTGSIGTGVRILFPFGLLARLITMASAQVYYAPGYGQKANVLHAYKFPGSHWQEATGPVGSCGLDGTAGGYRHFFSFTDSPAFQGLLGDFDGLFSKRNFYSVRDKACFIPTLSGLGYTQLPADNCTPAGQNLVCNGTTPFDAYYGPIGHNEEHIQLTPGNVEFIRNEILLKTPTPVFSSTPTAICVDGSPVTFSVQATCVANRVGQPQPATSYTWTAGPGLRLSSRQGQPTMLVQPVAGFSGTSTVQVVATRAGYAASAPIVTQVSVRSGYLQLSGPTGSECYYTTLTYDLSSELTQQNVVWHVYLNNVLRDDFIQQDLTSSLLVQPTATGNLLVTASDNDACGSHQLLTAYASTIIVSEFRNPDGSILSCPQMRLRPTTTPVAYPNPADKELTVFTDDSPTAEKPGSAILYNAQGKEVRRVLGKTQMQTADLPAGLYHLVVEQHGKVRQCQIKVEH